jgi:hypothetical protein
MTPDERAAAMIRVARDTKASGVPFYLEDPAVIRQVAAILASPSRAPSAVAERHALQLVGAEHLTPATTPQDVEQIAA